MARAQEIVDALPEENAKEAINRLDNELQPVFCQRRSHRCSRIFNKERSNRSDALALKEQQEAEKRLALTRSIQKIRDLINTKSFAQARQQLNAISAADRDFLGAGFRAVQDDLRSAEEFRKDVLIREISQTRDLGKIDQTVETAQAEGLSQEVIRQVKQEANQRKEWLAKQAAAKQATLAANRKRELNGFVSAINKLRANTAENKSPRIRSLTSLASDYTRRFSFDDFKEMSRNIRRIGEMADEIGSHLSSYIKNEQPRFSYEGNRGTITARMDHLEDDGVWLDIGGVLTKMKLTNPAIGHGNLIANVAEYAGLSQDHIAAYAWIWPSKTPKNLAA